MRRLRGYSITGLQKNETAIVHERTLAARVGSHHGRFALRRHGDQKIQSTRASLFAESEAPVSVDQGLSKRMGVTKMEGV